MSADEAAQDLNKRRIRVNVTDRDNTVIAVHRVQKKPSVLKPEE